MLHTTLWSPDTCDCQIEIEWDDSQKPEDRVHTSKKILKKCDAHTTAGIRDKHEHFATVLGENQKKNIAYGKLLEQFPDLVEDHPTAGKQFKPHVNLKVSFEGSGVDRKLIMDLEGVQLTPAEKKKIQDVTK